MGSWTWNERRWCRSGWTEPLPGAARTLQTSGPTVAASVATAPEVPLPSHSLPSHLVPHQRSYRCLAAVLLLSVLAPAAALAAAPPTAPAPPAPAGKAL